MYMWKRRMQTMIEMEAEVQVEVVCAEAGNRSGSDFTISMDVKIEAEAPCKEAPYSEDNENAIRSRNDVEAEVEKIHHFQYLCLVPLSMLS